jgi:hypothetical protein
MGHISFWCVLMVFNLLSENMSIIKKHTDTPSDASEEADSEINTENTVHVHVCLQT